MKEKIYRLYSSGHEYKTVEYDNTPLMNCLENNLWEPSLIEAYKFEWNRDDAEKETSDCPFLIGAIPIFKTEIISDLRNIVSLDAIKIININISGQKYSILRPKNKIKGLLNIRKSNINYFSDGRIMSIDKYVFNSNKNIPLFFELEEYPLFTFVNETMANVLVTQNVKGLLLEACEIRRRGFLFF